MFDLILGWVVGRTGFGMRERGASLIEYVLIIAVVAIAVFVGAQLGLGDAISGIFNDATTELNDASGG